MTEYRLGPSSGALVPVRERRTDFAPPPVVECRDLSCDDDAMPGSILCRAHRLAELVAERDASVGHRDWWAREAERCDHQAEEGELIGGVLATIDRSLAETWRSLARGDRRDAKKARENVRQWGPFIDRLDASITDLESAPAPPPRRSSALSRTSSCPPRAPHENPQRGQDGSTHRHRH